MQRTKIEYLSHTWNPLAMRCTPVSAGCKNCWHLRMAQRFSGMKSFPSDILLAYRGKSQAVIRQDDLAAPLRTKKPAVIGVNFMGDLFHESVTNEQIFEIFSVMALATHHTLLCLTKRPERMFKWFEWHRTSNRIIRRPDTWPLPNVMLGVSVEDQAAADERIPWLLKTPAAKRFVSCEPLLGPVDLGLDLIEPETGYQHTSDCPNYCEYACGGVDGLGGIDLVIAGAETGPGKRPAELDWFRSLRDQCAAADVPFFFKQDSDGSRELDGRTHEEMP